MSEASPSLVRGLMIHVREVCGGRLDRIDDDQLEDMVTSGIARACAHGFVREASLTAFVTLMFLLAPNFDEHPAVRAILSATHPPADERLAGLLGELSERQLTEVRARRDDGAFFPGRGADAPDVPWSPLPGASARLREVR